MRNYNQFTKKYSFQNLTLVKRMEEEKQIPTNKFQHWNPVITSTPVREEETIIQEENSRSMTMTEDS